MPNHNQILSIFKNVNPEDVVFWTGAGISMQKPTNLPNGADLSKICMEEFIRSGSFDSVIELFKNGKFKDSYGNFKVLPRLELIIDDIVGVLGFKAFEYFSFLNIPDKYLNQYHLFFAKHIENDGVHFTMNLDNGIETAINFNKPQKKIIHTKYKLFKLHGTITEKTCYKDLGLSLKNITAGFSDTLTKTIFNNIVNAKILCFIGYGAVDSFDVSPFFDKFIGNIRNNTLGNLKVIWLSYENYKRFKACKSREVDNSATLILKGLKNAGAKIYTFKGNGIRLISFLENLWNWKLQKIRTFNSYDWKKILRETLHSRPISFDIKNLIGGQYMAALGAGEKALYFCSPAKSPNSLIQNTDFQKGIFTSQLNQWWRVYTNGLRDLGKYKEAIKNIKKWNKIVDSSFDRFVVLSRLMGEYRIRGNFFLAFLTYRKAKNTLNNTIVRNDNPDELFALSEFWITYLHIYKDFWKLLPKFKKLLFLCLKGFIIKAWLNAFFVNMKKPSPHISTNLLSLAQEFSGESEYFMKQARLKEPNLPLKIEKCFKVTDLTNFFETDSLLGDINNQRNKIDKDKKYDLLIDEIENNLVKTYTISDCSGMFKAYLRLAKGYFERKNFLMAIENVMLAFKTIRKVEYSVFYRTYYKCKLTHILIMSKFYLCEKSHY